MNPFNLSEKEYINIKSKSEVLPKWKLARFLCFIVSTIFLMSVYNGIGGEINWLYLLGILLMINAIIVFIVFKKVAYNYSKGFRTNKSIQQEIRIKFDDVKIEFESDSGSFRANWTDIYKAKIFDEFTLLYQSTDLYRPVMHSAFESDDERNSFFSFLGKVGLVDKIK